MIKYRFIQAATILSLSLSSMAVMAATLGQPDVGVVLESVEIPAPKRPKEPPKIEFLTPLEAIAPDKGGATIQVDGFIITGATVFTEEALLKVVAPFTGRELSFQELRGAAVEITNFYNRAGYFATYAFIPPQDVISNKVELQVLEGRMGKVRVSGLKRLRKGVVDNLLEGADGVLHAAPLERRLLLLDDLPGVKVESQFSRGEAPGTADLDVTVKEEDLISGYLSFDNYGSYYIGDRRLTGQLDVNNALGIGDQLSVKLLSSGNGMRHHEWILTAPVNRYGTKTGIDYKSLEYKIRKEFRFLESEGTVWGLVGFVTHPFIRSRTFNLNAKLSLGFSEIDQTMFRTSVRSDKIIVGMAQIKGNFMDTFAGGGDTTFDMDWSSGKDNYYSPAGGPPAEDESFQAFHPNLSRLQQISGPFSFYASFSGQYSSNILPSSEQFSLGGPSKVRAYSPRQGGGDKGGVVSGELRFDVPALSEKWFGTNAQLVGFVDHGRTLSNSNDIDQSLSGVGLGVNLFHVPMGFSVKTSYAWALNSNEEATKPEGKNSRLWIELGHFF